jgi:hypothetical protein
LTSQDASDTDVGSSSAESSSQVRVALDYDGGLHRDFVEITLFLLAGFSKVAAMQPFSLVRRMDRITPAVEERDGQFYRLTDGPALVEA